MSPALNPWMSWVFLWAATKATSAASSMSVTFSATFLASPAAVLASPAAVLASPAASVAAFILASTFCLVSSATFLASLAVLTASSALVSVSSNEVAISFNVSSWLSTLAATSFNFSLVASIFFLVSSANAVTFSSASFKALVVLSRAVLVSAKPVFNSPISDLLLFTDLSSSATVSTNPGVFLLPLSSSTSPFTVLLRSLMLSINPGFWSSFGSPTRRFLTRVIAVLTFSISLLSLSFCLSSLSPSSFFAALIFSSTAVFALLISVFTWSLL